MIDDPSRVAPEIKWLGVTGKHRSGCSSYHLPRRWRPCGRKSWPLRSATTAVHRSDGNRIATRCRIEAFWPKVQAVSPVQPPSGNTMNPLNHVSSLESPRTHFSSTNALHPPSKSPAQHKAVLMKSVLNIGRLRSG